VHGEKRVALEERSEMFAGATGFTVLREYTDKQYANYNLHRSLSGAICNRLHTPSLTIEAGPRLFANKDIVGATVNAVLGALGTIGVTPQQTVAHDTKINHDNLRRSPGPKPTKAGVLHLTVAPGDKIEKGTAIAEVRDLKGQTIETLRSAGEAYVIALPERAWAKSGVAVGTFAVEDK
jgi:predicted deacylase